MQNNFKSGITTGDDELLSLLDDDVYDGAVSATIEASDDLLDLLETDDGIAEVHNDLQNMGLSDILDHEYEMQEKQKMESSFLSFEHDYNQDSESMGIEINQEIDPLEDQYLFDHDEAEELSEDQDAALIKEMQDKLITAGYKHVELYDYEQLEKLLEQEETLNNEDIYNTIKLSFVDSYNKVSTAVQSSKATLMKANSTVRTLTQDIPTAGPALSEYFTKLVWRDLELLIVSSQDRPDLESYITVNLVINRLNRTLPPDQKIYLETVDLYQYLLIAIPAAINAVKAAKNAMLEDEIQKKKIVSYVLRDEAKAVKAIENSNGKFIKQIFRRGDNFTYYCTHCGKEVKLPSKIISYILYAAEREDSSASIMPHLIVCPGCGQEHLLAFMQYLNMRSTLSSIYKASANELFKYLTKISSGTAITKINPSLQDIMSGVDTVCDLGLSEAYSEKIISKKSVNNSTIAYADFEYDRAIEDFYNKLLIFGRPKEEPLTDTELQDDTLLEKLDGIEAPAVVASRNSHLTYKEVALCVTSELSLNYQTTKNRALYSLVMFLSEYDFSRSALDCTTYWDALNQLRILKKADSINSNDKEYVAYYKHLANEIGKGNIDDINQLREEMLAYHSVVEKSIEDWRDSNEKLTVFIGKHLDLLSHTKILNINQINFKEVAKFCNSQKFTELLDEITDRMIINNYSEKFADTLFKSSILRGLRIKTCLLNMSDGYKLQENVLHTLEQKGVSVPTEVADRLRYVSANHLQGIRAASAALKNYEYFSFIEALSQVEDTSTLISPEADELLKQAVTLAKSKWEDLKDTDYVHFYLKDFTKEEIEDIDPSLRAELAHMVFGKYVPKRKGQESLSDYVVRYKQLESTGLLSAEDSYSYKELFKEFAEYFMVIASGANVLELNCDNFAIASFVRSWLSMTTSYHNREYGMGSLGYNEYYFNRLSALNSYEIRDSYFSFVDNTYRVLNGIFLDASSEFVNQYVDLYDSYTLNERTDLGALEVITSTKIMDDLERMDPAELNRLELQYQSTKKSDVDNISSEEIVISKEDIVNTLEMFMEV